MALNKNKISFLKTDKLIEKYGEHFSAYLAAFTEQSARYMQAGSPVIGGIKKTLKATLDAPDRYHPFASIIHQQMVKVGRNDYIHEYLDVTLDEAPFPAIMTASYLVSEFPELVNAVDNWDNQISPYLWLANDILLNRYLANRPALINIDESTLNYKPDDNWADAELYVQGVGFDAIVSSKNYTHDDPRYLGVCAAFELTGATPYNAQVIEVALFKKGVGAEVIKSEYVTFCKFGGKIAGLDINNIEFENLDYVLALLASINSNGLDKVSDARDELLEKMASAKSPSKKKRLVNKLAHAQNEYALKEADHG
ncbi:hypothetical protein [Vibrio crassostreae]|uniref:hypothetical protein n=1 Tax=Vibrio crassostreae TaxID=246167 RepID=UPI001B315194|nr:hypothetical protein [Vibrio crassostreae]